MQQDAVGATTVLTLGKGWFPDELGGLERYFRTLLEHTEGARAVVVGPAGDPPANLRAASDHSASLPRRLGAYWLAVERELGEAAVIDAHFALYAALPVLLGRARQRPLMVHFQGPWADESVAAGDSSGLRRALRRRLEGSVYRRADVAVVLTGAFRQLLVERYGVSPWRVRVLAPGVELDAFTPGEQARAREWLGLEAGAFVACCVRRLVPRMGVGTLLAAWADVAAQVTRSGRPARLLIAGDGPLADELAEQARELRLEGVKLLGRVDEAHLLELYRAADVNLLPTVAYEGFGLTVLEAAACGTPSLVTRVGGLPEAVRGLGENLVVAPGDTAALARRLRAAAAGDLPSREHARAWAQTHAWERVSARHAALRTQASASRRQRGHRPRLAGTSARDRLRVVYLGHVASLSGGEIALLRLLQALSATGAVEPHVILAQDGPLVGRLNEAGVSVEVMTLGERTRDLRRERVSARGLPLGAGLDTARYVARLARHLRRLQPDLVHTNTLKAGVYGGLAARLAGVPVLWHVRDQISPDYLPGNAVWLMRRLISLLPTAVVANSESTAATVGASRRAGGSVVIGEVATVARGATANGNGNGAVHGPFVAGMVGRISPWKGQHVFLQAFARAFPAGDERAVLVGSAMFGEDGYEHELHTLAASLSLGDRVEFRGFRDDIAAELDGMDVLVHASTSPEPFGQVVLEGLGRGVPVIAADAGGPAELIATDRTGLLYPPGDVEALASQLRRIAADAPLRARLADAGAERARDFAPELVATRMLAVYRGAVARHAAGQAGSADRRDEPPSSPS